MIEKLPFEITQGEYQGKNFDIKSPTSPFDMQVKINELVDAVNELQENYDNVCIWVGEQKLKNNTEKPADPYAEQRKWIGKVCRFFDSDKDDARIGVLSAIQNGMYFIKHTSTAYDYCEPVKPDDDVIFKGE